MEGAEAGDLLEVRIEEIRPEPFGYTTQIPGFGFLRDVFDQPHLVRWKIADGWATSEDLPGVKIPGRAVHGRHWRGAVHRAARDPDRPRG